MIRARFAPSPTGYLHIGGVRTALFNWLFARHNKGKFVLRIEDTDKVRSSEEYLNQIFDDLKWLGLDWDEGPFFQSKRTALYTKLAEKLLKEGKAYNDGSAIILKVPDKPYEFTDIIRGPIKFEAGSLKDQVLMKSDGSPTYNFACCVDDREMKITHVIRGDDHISNTPKQLAIYEALGVELPQFAHIPLIVAADRSRLSKRKGAQPVSFYKDQGYLPEALFNFLALLGWSPGEDREIISKNEMIKEFSLERVVKTAAFFNTEKLEWMNGQYILNSDTIEIAKQVTPFLLEQKYITEKYDKKRLSEIVELFKPRIKKLSDFPELAGFFFTDDLKLDEEAVKFLSKKENTKQILQNAIGALEKLTKFDLQAIEDACREVIARENIKGGELIHPVRVSLTGKRVGPGLFELMAVMGKDEVIKRLKQAHSCL